MLQQRVPRPWVNAVATLFRAAYEETRPLAPRVARIASPDRTQLATLQPSTEASPKGTSTQSPSRQEVQDPQDPPTTAKELLRLAARSNALRGQPQEATQSACPTWLSKSTTSS